MYNRLITIYMYFGFIIPCPDMLNPNMKYGNLAHHIGRTGLAFA